MTWIPVAPAARAVFKGPASPLIASSASVEGSGAPGAKIIWLCLTRPGFNATSGAKVCAGGGDAFAIVGAGVFDLDAGASAPEDGPAFGTKEKGTEVVENRSADGGAGFASFPGGAAGVFATCFA